MRKYNRIFSATLGATLLLVSLGACESLEGERRLLTAANISLFIPANWEATHGDDAVLELQPRGVKTVKVRVVVDDNPGTLDETVQQEMREAAALEKKAGIKLADVTRIEIKRGTLAGARVVFQMSLPAKQKGGEAAEMSQIEDIFRIDKLSVGVVALGPKQDIDKVAAEIDRILSSVRSMTPEPEAERVYPPDAVTSASQRATQNGWR